MPEAGDTITRRARRNHSPAFQAKVALATIRGEQTLLELSQQFDVHTNQIKQWKDQLLGVFGKEAKEGLRSGKNDRPPSKLSVVRQAKLFDFSRGSVYYLPRPASDGDLALMCRIGAMHLEYPFTGSRILLWLLKGEGLETGRLHIATLMKKIGIEAIYRHTNTSKPSPGHKIYPYLLRKLVVAMPKQVCWIIQLANGLLRTPTQFGVKHNCSHSDFIGIHKLPPW